MKTIAATSIALFSMIAGSAWADDGLTLGASIGHANIEDGDNTLSFDADDTGYKLFANYTFANYFAIEGGYIDFGEPSDDVLGQRGVIDADGWTLYGVGALPLSDSFDLFAKAGVISWDAEATIDGIPIVGTDDGEDLALGIGGRWSSNGVLGLRAEFEWFDISEVDDVWMASVGVEFRF